MASDQTLSIVCAILASQGVWTLLTEVYKRRTEKKSAIARGVRGILHDRILHLGNAYIKRGWITTDEYENLVDDMYTPYKEMGGNGTAKKVVEEVGKLPIKDKTAG